MISDLAEYSGVGVAKELRDLGTVIEVMMG